MDVVAEAREFVERQMRSRFAKVRAKTHRLQQPALKPVCCTVEEQKATETRPLLLTSKSKATKRPPVSAFSFKCRPSRAPRLDRDGFVLSSSFGSRSLPPGTAQCAAAETAAPRLESRNAWSPWSRRPSAAHVPRFSFGSVGSDGTEASLTYSSCHGSCVGSRVATWGNIGCTGVMEAEDETREESDAGQVCAVKTLTLSSILHKEPEVEVARRLSWDEQAKWRSSFNRFRHDGEIHKDDLINALEHCGFDDRRPDLVQETLVQVTSYAALDREEFLRFVCLYETRLHELYRSEFHRYASEGVMRVSGLPQLLQEFGLEPRRYVLQELLSETQSSEHLEFHDVAKIMELLRAREGFLVAELERFRRVFQDFDSDASGDMSVNELGSALCWLGFPHSHEKIEVLYQEGDIDRSGSLNESEFVVVLRRIQDGELGTIRSFLQSTENCEVSTLKELELLLGKLGYYQTSAAALMDAMQAAGIGTDEDKLSADMHLDLDDICTLLHYLRNREGFTDAQMEDLRLAFQKGKQEDAEKIPVSILHKALRWLGHCYTFDRAQQLIYEVDASAGAMDFTTFVKLVRKCRDFERRAAIGAFYAADPRHVGTLDEAGACLALSKIGLLEFQKGEEQQTDLEHFLLQVMRCQEERLHCLRKNCAFTPGQLEELRYHFKKSDKEGNGVLKRYDLARLVETLFPAQAHLCEFRPFLVKLLEGLEPLDFPAFIYLCRRIQDETDSRRCALYQEVLKDLGFSCREAAELLAVFLPATDEGARRLSCDEMVSLFIRAFEMTESECHLLRNIFDTEVPEAEGGQLADFLGFMRVMRQVVDTLGSLPPRSPA
ncbi:unnamed protein product [Effrenium voratum]|uniref:Calmodulin n=1 Tax=Effrenium voratum TaxID=2562239 RepID=A0AA36IS28_9DINO|nr:unnamed protein product [Effrenium voratum]CAJ1414785.1 unnamed protein product [Effrenium voratum]